MKTKISTLIFFCLLLQTLTGQDPVLKGGLFPVTELSEITKKLIRLASIPSAKSGSQRNQQDFVLDSTIRHEILGGSDPEPAMKTEHFYPSEGFEEIFEYGYGWEEYTLLSKVEIESDNLGRRLKITAYSYNSQAQTFTPDSKIEVFPHKESFELMDSFYVSRWTIDQTWEREFSTENLYDEEDRLLQVESILVIQDEPITLVEDYIYHEDQLQRIENYALIEGELLPGGYSNFLYPDALTTEKIDYSPDEHGILEPVSREVTIHTQRGKVELHNSYIYDMEKQDWKLTQVNGYVYDDEERVSMHETVVINEVGTVNRTSILYSYLLDELISREDYRIYASHLEEWEATGFKNYFYSPFTSGVGDGPTITQPLTVYPNPVVDRVTIEIPAPGELTLYSLDGQLVQRLNTTSNQESISLSAFSSGTYFVLLTSDEGKNYTNTIIKQ